MGKSIFSNAKTFFEVWKQFLGKRRPKRSKLCYRRDDWSAFFYNRKMAPPPPPPPPFMSCFLVRSGTNSGTRRRIDIFQKRKVFRIEFPEILAWFQTPQTVSRPSRPDFQPRKTNSGSRRPIEILKERKMITIEFPKLLAWFQTHQPVSRPSRPCPDRPDTLTRD